MESRKLGVKLERFAVVPDRCLLVPMLLQFVCHHLMHPGGCWSHQRQAEHSFAGKVRMNPIGGVEHFYIGGIQAAKSADGRCGFVQIASSSVDFNQLHTCCYLNFLVLQLGECFFQVCASALAVASPPLPHTPEALHPP